MNLLKSAWFFLGLFQTKYMRLFHVIVLLSVIIQILVSTWMYTPHLNNTISYHFFNVFCTWLHITFGLINVILVPLFILYCFNTRRLAYFFPYLFGDFQSIKNDLIDLIKLKLPKMGFPGLASSVEGLGLGALLLAILSGFIWFLLWIFNNADSRLFLHLHKSLVILIEIYVFAHGFMAILHFLVWNKKSTI